MGAVARARAFERRGNPLCAAGGEIGVRVAPPRLLVEVRGEEPAGVVDQHRIDAQGVAPAKMSLNRFIGDRHERLVGTGPAPHPGLVAHAALPLVGADRRVAGRPLPGILPAPGIHILAAGEEGAEERDLVARRGPVRDLPAVACDLRYRRSSARKLGEPLVELRPLRVEPREALAYPLRLSGTGVRLGHPALQRCRRSWAGRSSSAADHTGVRSGAPLAWRHSRAPACVIGRRASSFRCWFPDGARRCVPEGLRFRAGRPPRRRRSADGGARTGQDARWRRRPRRPQSPR